MTTSTVSPERIAILRERIAISRRRQELYLDIMADSMILAAQQVQDRRIDFLEEGPETTVGDIFVDILLSAVAGVGPLLLVEGAKRMLLPILRARRASIAEVRPIVLASRLDVKTINKARNVELTASFPRTQSGGFELHRDVAEKLLEASLGTGKNLLVSITQNREPSNTQTGGDTAGVGITDAVLSYVRQQKATVSICHDFMDIHILHGDEETASELAALLEENLSTGPKTDLSALREEFKLFFEACIWVTLFRGLEGIIRKEGRRFADRGLGITGGTVPTSLDKADFVKIIHLTPEKLRRYWLARFKSLILQHRNKRTRQVTQSEVNFDDMLAFFTDLSAHLKADNRFAIMKLIRFVKGS